MAAGFLRLCIAPNGTPSSELADLLLLQQQQQHSTHSSDDIDGTHRHHHRGSSGSGAGAPCGRDGFIALLRKGDAAAQARAEAYLAGAAAAAASAATQSSLAVRADGTVSSSSSDPLLAPYPHAWPPEHALQLAAVADAWWHAAALPAPDHSLWRVPPPASLRSMWEAAVAAEAAAPAAPALLLPPLLLPAGAGDVHGASHSNGVSGGEGGDPGWGDTVRGNTRTSPLTPSLLGEEGEDLLWGLLRWEPAERLTMEEVLRHPFLMRRQAREGEGGEDDVLDEAV